VQIVKIINLNSSFKLSESAFITTRTNIIIRFYFSVLSRDVKKCFFLKKKTNVEKMFSSTFFLNNIFLYFHEKNKFNFFLIFLKYNL